VLYSFDSFPHLSAISKRAPLSSSIFTKSTLPAAHAIMSAVRSTPQLFSLTSPCGSNSFSIFKSPPLTTAVCKHVSPASEKQLQAAIGLHETDSQFCQIRTHILLSHCLQNFLHLRVISELDGPVQHSDGRRLICKREIIAIHLHHPIGCCWESSCLSSDQKRFRSICSPLLCHPQKLSAGINTSWMGRDRRLCTCTRCL
jgi:hypothetical protein